VDAGRDVRILGVKWRPFVQFVYLPMWASAPDPGVTRAVFVGPSTAAVRDRGRRASAVEFGPSGRRLLPRSIGVAA
jgi:hypothetical protein